MPKRLMPTRDNLRRSHGALNASENDIAGVELMLYLIRASDVIREGNLRRTSARYRAHRGEIRTPDDSL